MAVRSFAGVAAVLAVLLAGSGSTVLASGAPASVRVWGDGAEWEAMIGGTGTVRAKWQPFYLIAAIDPASPQSLGMWGFGRHDHVMEVDHRGGGHVGPCKVLVVVPGPNGVPGMNVEVVPDPDLGIPMVRAADVDGDGAMEPLTSASQVDRATAAGLVSAFEPRPGGTPIAFRCPVRPLH